MKKKNILSSSEKVGYGFPCLCFISFHHKNVNSERNLGTLFSVSLSVNLKIVVVVVVVTMIVVKAWINKL